MSVSGVTSYDTTYSIRVDEVSTDLTYVGEAQIGTDDNSPSWKIKRLLTTGTVLAITWADGNQQFDNIWANRAALSYT